MKNHFRFVFVVPPSLKLEEKTADGKTVWVGQCQVCMVGTWEHPWYGEVKFTRDDHKQMVQNFDNGDRDVCVDYQHSSLSADPDAAIAAGWVTKLYGKDRWSELWAEVEWTEKAKGHIEAKEYKYISPELCHEYVDKNGEQIGCTLLAVALTNRPFLEGMAEVETPVALSEGIDVPPIYRRKKETHKEGGAQMDDAKVREVLGLAENVPITDAHRTEAQNKLYQIFKNPPAPVVPASPAPGTVTLTAAEVVQLQADASQGKAAAVQLRTMERDNCLNDAIRKGTVLPSEKDGLIKLFEIDHAAALTAINGRTTVLVDLSERGSSSPGDNTQDVGEFVTAETGKGRSLSEVYTEAEKKFGVQKVDSYRYVKPNGRKVNAETAGA